MSPHRILFTTLLIALLVDVSSKSLPLLENAWWWHQQAESHSTDTLRELFHPQYARHKDAIARARSAKEPLHLLANSEHPWFLAYYVAPKLVFSGRPECKQVDGGSLISLEREGTWHIQEPACSMEN